MTKTRAEFDLSRGDDLVASIVGGASSSWTSLVEVLCPALLTFARQSSSLGHRRSEDDCQEVMTRVLERLRKNEFRALRTFELWRRETRNADKTLADWLRIVIDRVACDYVTHCARRSVLHTYGVALDSGIAPGKPSAMTDIQAVRQLIEHAERALPPDQIEIVRRVFDGEAIEDIAVARGHSTEAVSKQLRAAYARLRRWVDDDGASEN